MKLALNRTAAALLRRYEKLKTLVALTVGGKTVSKATVTLTEPAPAKQKQKEVVARVLCIRRPLLSQ